jgi:NAD-dependent deacetylase
VGDLSLEEVCEKCERAGGVRPDIVWFGEMPYHMDRIFDALNDCDLFISIGTSGNVYPAAGFVSEALRGGAATIEFNLDPAQNATLFHEQIYGPAGTTVPEFVERLLPFSKTRARV